MGAQQYRKMHVYGIVKVRVATYLDLSIYLSVCLSVCLSVWNLDIVVLLYIKVFVYILNIYIFNKSKSLYSEIESTFARI